MLSVHKDAPNIHNLKQRLTLRFGLLLSLFLMLFGVSFVFTKSAVDTKEYDSVIVNIAGRQRTLIQKYASEINLVLVGLAISDWEMALEKKKISAQTAGIFERTHLALTKGGDTLIGTRLHERIHIPRIESQDIQEHLGHVKAEWDELKRAAVMSLRSDIKSLTDNEYVALIQTKTVEAISKMDHVTTQLQQESEMKLRRIKTLQILMLGIAGILFIGISVFVYWRIVTPLDISTKQIQLRNIQLSSEIAERERAEEKVEFLNKFLEQRVTERTEKLEKVNKKLELEIEDRKISEESLKKYKILFDNIHDLAYICDTRGNFLFVNKAFEKLTGHKPEEYFGKPFATLFDEENLRKATDVYKRTLKGESLQYELYFKDTGLLCEYKNLPLRDGKENIIGVIGVARDITEHKQAEVELLFEKEFSEMLINSSVDGILAFNNDCYYTVWNDGMEYISGVSKEKCLGKKAFDVFPFLKEIGEDKYFYAALNGEKVIAKDRPYNIPETNKKGFFEGHYSPIRDKAGEIVGGLAIIRDVTERKKTEEQIKASLSEKEILLREIYHRTKNNMQVICSLLNLQFKYTENEQMLNLSREIQNRIKSMALVHEKLYQSKDLSRINLKSYIEDLTHSLFKAYHINTNEISFKYKADDVLLTIDSAIPCGLVINEIITNSLKYAFPGNREGEISIDLHLTDEGLIELRIADNGISLPEDFDLKETNSLGFQIITSLIESQLQGQVKVNIENGAEFLISFREPDREKRV